MLPVSRVMMESCFNSRHEEGRQVVMEDLKKDLLMEFRALPDSEVRLSRSQTNQLHWQEKKIAQKFEQIEEKNDNIG